MKGDALEAFLKKMRLIKDDSGMDPLIEEYFGDVKGLIDKEWVTKLHYLECKKIDDDPDHQQYEYKWYVGIEIYFRKVLIFIKQMVVIVGEKEPDLNSRKVTC